MHPCTSYVYPAIPWSYPLLVESWDKRGQTQGCPHVEQGHGPIVSSQ